MACGKEDCALLSVTLLLHSGVPLFNLCLPIRSVVEFSMSEYCYLFLYLYVPVTLLEHNSCLEVLLNSFSTLSSVLQASSSAQGTLLVQLYEVPFTFYFVLY